MSAPDVLVAFGGVAPDAISPSLAGTLDPLDVVDVGQADSLPLTGLGPTDPLDYNENVLIQAGLRCDTSVLCGVYRCGFGIQYLLVFRPLLTPADPD